MQDKRLKSALKWITFSLLFMAMANALSNNMIGVTLTSIIRDFKLEGAAQGAMNSFIQVGGIIALLICPLLQGKVKKIYVIILMCVVQALSLLLTGLAGSYGMLLFACTLQGIGFVATDTFVNSYMADMNPGDSKMLGLTHGCFGIGGLFAPIAVQMVIDRSGWRFSYMFATIVFCAFLAVLAVVGLSNNRRVPKEESIKEAPLTPAMVKEYFSNKRNLLLVATAIMYTVAQMGILNWTDYYIVNRYAVEGMGAISLSIYWITSAVSRIYGTRLPIAPKTVSAWGNVISGVAFLFAVLIPTPMSMLIASGVIGLTSGLVIPVLISEVAIGNEDRTSLTTVSIFLSANVIRLILSPVFGAVNVVLVMLLPAICSVLAGLLGFMANRCPVKGSASAER